MGRRSERSLRNLVRKAPEESVSVPAAVHHEIRRDRRGERRWIVPRLDRREHAVRLGLIPHSQVASLPGTDDDHPGNPAHRAEAFPVEAEKRDLRVHAVEQFRDAAGPVLEFAVLVALLLGHRSLEHGRERERPPAVDDDRRSDLLRARVERPCELPLDPLPVHRVMSPFEDRAVAPRHSPLPGTRASSRDHLAASRLVDDRVDPSRRS